MSLPMDRKASRLVAVFAASLFILSTGTPAHGSNGDFHIGPFGDSGLLFRPPSGSEPNYQDGTFRGGIGLETIDGTTYYSVDLRPEFTFGRFGLGLFIPLRYHTETGELREEDWDSTSDRLRVIRYARWGHKGDPLYARFGIQDNATIGHGSLVRHYTSAIDEDEQRTGLVFDLDQDAWGIETLLSNLESTELVGGRVYVRPFRSAGFGTMILQNVGLGASYVTDINHADLGGTPDDGGDPGDPPLATTSLWSVDLEFAIYESSGLNAGLYYDHAAIVDFGSGDIFGIYNDIYSETTDITLRMRMERRILGDKFVVGYVDPFYELTRSTKRQGLHDIKAVSGWFGEMSASVFGSFHVLGSYEWFDEDPEGWLHMEANLIDVIPSIRARATYDRSSTLGDIYHLDEDSQFAAEAGYQFNSWMWLVGSFRRTWEQASEDNWSVPGVPEYEPSDRMSVRVEFVLDFDLGD